MSIEELLLGVTLTTDASGELEVLLPPGNYTLSELTPDGYTPLALITFTVLEGDNPIDLLKKLAGTGYIDLDKLAYNELTEQNILTNIPFKADLYLRKIDEEDTPLQGIVFTLTRLDTEPPEVQTATTDASGLANFTELVAGIYSLTEEPLTGYLGITPIIFTYDGLSSTLNLLDLLDAEYPELDDITYEEGVHTILNHVTPDPELRIRKLDETGRPMAGIPFTLTQTNVIPYVEKTEITDTNGELIFVLPTGTYRLNETAPTGYLPLETMLFTVTDEDTVVNLVWKLSSTGEYPDLSKIDYEPVDGFNIITNSLIPQLLIQKVDENGLPMAGVQFVLTRLGGSPATSTTDSEGLLAFSLPVGDYLLSETATSGYQGIAPMSFSVSETDSIIDLKKN